MAKKIMTIGLKSVKYADVAESGVPTTFTKEVSVVHEDTWAIEMEEAQYQDYINMLTKRSYYKEKTQEATERIVFSIGQYTLTDKAEFMGGTATVASPTENEKWTPGTGDPIYKAFQVVTEDGVQITYPYALVNASHGRNQNALGLNVNAEPLSHPDGVTSIFEWEILGTKTA